MHPAIQIREDYERGCGWRGAGRMYLVCDGPAMGCGKMPIPLEVCPCCGMGIKPSRAPVWIEQPERLWRDLSCTSERCNLCPMSAAYETGPALLIWVGEKFYKNGSDFVRESRVMGISRFIQRIPKGFIVGQTWVLLAHRRAQEIAPLFSDKPHYQQGIFSMFRPERIEIVVTGNESNEEIEGYLKRGLTPVITKRKERAVTEIEAIQTGIPGTEL